MPMGEAELACTVAPVQRLGAFKAPQWNTGSSKVSYRG